MEIAKCGDGFFAGAEHEVIGVGQDDLRPGGGDHFREQALDGALRADGHEGGGVEMAMAGCHPAEAGAGGGVLLNQLVTQGFIGHLDSGATL